MASVRIPDQGLEQIDQFTRSEVGIGTLERYTGSCASEIQPYILLTNFMRYVDLFAERAGAPVRSGSAMRACHSPEQGITSLPIDLGIQTLIQMQTRGQDTLGYQY